MTTTGLVVEPVAVSVMDAGGQVEKKPAELAALEMFPVILIAVLSGKWLLPHIPQKPFNDTVLVLVALAALYLFIPKA